MPPRRVVGCNAQLGKAVHISVILDFQMRTGHLHAEIVAQFLLGQLHAVEYRAG